MSPLNGVCPIKGVDLELRMDVPLLTDELISILPSDVGSF